MYSLLAGMLGCRVEVINSNVCLCQGGKTISVDGLNVATLRCADPSRAGS